MTVKDATSVTKIRNSGKTHLHKIRKRLLWNREPREMGKHTSKLYIENTSIK